MASSLSGRTVTLVRELRFAADADLLAAAGPVLNGFAGWPAPDWIAPQLTLRVALAGPIDPATGMLINIVAVDDALRRAVLPAVCRQLGAGRVTLAHALLAAADALRDLPPAAWPAGVAATALALFPDPHRAVACLLEGPAMPRTVFLTEQFEFSASHRLHSDRLSDADNRRVFGKCNNPAGHGHNYVLEVTVAGAPDAAGQVLPLAQFERVVKTEVLDVMDHRHLTSEVAPFNAGVNSTVEQIAAVCFDRLAAHVAPARLHRVRVWETPKTWAEVYAAGPAGVEPVL